MNLIELHILQSFPVSCLNRDELNSPKTAIFGGVQRSRVSSQCWKRQIRLACNDLNPTAFNGQRSRQFIGEITRRLNEAHGARADALSRCLCHHLGKLDSKNFEKVKTIAYYSAGELDRFAAMIHRLDSKDQDNLVEAYGQLDLTSSDQDGADDSSAELEDADHGKGKKKEKAGKKMNVAAFTKLVNKIFKPALKKEFQNTPMAKDAADIALFGRMVAADHSLTLEGAAMFSHALSTHKSDNELDFFTAVDDLNPMDETGSGHMGSTEFNASVFYRYVALNLDLLADKEHLQDLSRDERQKVVADFIQATLTAIPVARRNSMNAATRPSYVLGLYKEKGQPIQLINAFEKPVSGGKDGIMETSIARLKQEHAALQHTWGISSQVEIAIPEITSPEFIQALITHVK